MATTASTRWVRADPDEVWDVLAGFADISRWGRGVSQSSLLTLGPPGPGATRRVQVGRSALRETVLRWEPGHVLAYDIVGLPPVVREAGNTWTLEADGTGTLVTLTGAVETRGGPLIGRIVARRLGQANDELLAGLVDHLEEERS